VTPVEDGDPLQLQNWGAELQLRQLEIAGQVLGACLAIAAAGHGRAPLEDDELARRAARLATRAAGELIAVTLTVEESPIYVWRRGCMATRTTGADGRRVTRDPRPGPGAGRPGRRPRRGFADVPADVAGGE
jgi:hypothetical protein